MLVVDPWHWLEEDGSLPTTNLRLRMRTIRVARLIEYGGPLGADESRETLVECSERPGGRPCMGLLWVTKTRSDEVHAWCAGCGGDEVLIHNWQETLWAEGMMDPIRDDEAH